MFQIEPFLGDFTYDYGSVLISTSTPTQVVGSSPNRALLIVGNFSGSNVLLTIDPKVTSAGAIVTLKGDGSSKEFYWEYHGVLTTLPWYGLSLNVPATIFYAELFWRPK